MFCPFRVGSTGLVWLVGDFESVARAANLENAARFIVGCVWRGGLGDMLGRAQPATLPSSKRQSVRLQLVQVTIFFWID